MITLQVVLRLACFSGIWRILYNTDCAHTTLLVASLLILKPQELPTTVFRGFTLICSISSQGSILGNSVPPRVK